MKTWDEIRKDFELQQKEISSEQNKTHKKIETLRIGGSLAWKLFLAVEGLLKLIEDGDLSDEYLEVIRFATTKKLQERKNDG